MPTSKIHLTNEGQTLSKFSLAFAGEAGDHIGGDSHIWDLGTRGLHQLSKSLGCSFTRHPPQGGCTPGLQGQMQMPGQTFILPEGEEIFVEIPGFQRR